MSSGAKAGEAEEYLSEYHGIMGWQRGITAPERGYRIDAGGLTHAPEIMTP